MQGSQSNFVVLLQEEKILLVLNPAKEICVGLTKVTKDRAWGLPGGGMKEIDGGSEKKGARREVEEETGFVIDEEQIQCLGHPDIKGTHTDWTVAAPIIAGTLRTTFNTSPDDVLDARWFPLSAVFDKEIFVYRAHRQRIEMALAILEKKPEWRFRHKL